MLIALAHLLVWYRRRQGWDIDEEVRKESTDELGEIKRDDAVL